MKLIKNIIINKLKYNNKLKNRHCRMDLVFENLLVM